MYEKEFYNFNRQAIGILCLVYPLVIINFNAFLLYTDRVDDERRDD